MKKATKKPKKRKKEENLEVDKKEIFSQESEYRIIKALLIKISKMEQYYQNIKM
jgi:hypothetical protein